MGYRFPAEVQNDRVYVKRADTVTVNQMRTPAVHRANNQKNDHNQWYEADQNQTRRHAKSFRDMYQSLTGQGGQVDESI